jgi:cysteine desulfurase
VLDPARRLQRRGIAVTVLPVNEWGAVEPQTLRTTLNSDTALVSVMAANNEVGTLNPVREIGEMCRNHGVLVHSDAVQWLGSGRLDLAEWPVDLLSLSAHKIYGPKGIGALVVRRDGERRIPLEPLLDGGGHEWGLRSGTLPVPLIVGFGAACRLLRSEREDEQRRIRVLRDRLWNRLRHAVDSLVLNGPPIDASDSATLRLYSNLNVSVARVDGEALMQNLRGLAVSSGSACTSTDPEPSHVLRALGRDAASARASLRFGLGRFNTADDVDRAVEVVAEAVRGLRSRSH